MTITDKDIAFMNMALEEARAAQGRNEVPVGAVIVHAQTGAILARSGNRSIEMKDPTAHAEILAIRSACAAAGAQRIPDHDLYVTLEPCAMCAAAISYARIRRVIFGAHDVKGGAVINGPAFYNLPTCHHAPDVAHGLLAEDSSHLLKAFFRDRR